MMRIATLFGSRKSFPGFTALNADGVVVVPIHTGVGVRLGINISYLKFTPLATWNPF